MAQQWTRQDELAATHLEVEAAYLHLIAQALGGRRMGKPPRVPRPAHVERRRKVERDPAAIAAFFSRN